MVFSINGDFVNRNNSILKLKIIVIIVTYNAEHWIKRCFGSIFSSKIDVSVIAVDNCSTDDTVDIISDLYPEVQIIKQSENLGFGKANNTAIQAAMKLDPNYVLLLNQDAWLENSTLDRLVGLSQNNKDFGILCPLQLNANGEKIDEHFFKYTVSTCSRFLSDALIFNQINHIYSVDFANAACWLLPVDVIKKVGGFDPLYPHYGEDEDYIRRVKQKGYKIGLCPYFKVHHDREFRSKKKSFKQEINNSYIELINLIKHNPKASLLSLFIKVFQVFYIYTINFFFLPNKKYRLALLLSVVKASLQIMEVRKHLRLEKNHFYNYLDS
jgi:GT2 family glycosyltransferase